LQTGFADSLPARRQAAYDIKSKQPAPRRPTTQRRIQVNGKFIVAVVVIFIAWMLGDFVVHAVLLKPEYMKLTGLFRPESEGGAYMPFMLLAHLLLSIAFVWIYTKGKEAKPFLAQGLRYGFVISLLATTPTYLIYYTISPYPPNVVVTQIVTETILCMLLGLIVAFIYREPATAAA
jgi:hypothetical protein